MERATRKLKTEPELALRELQALKAAWSDNPVHEELDFAILEALLEANRMTEARDLARMLERRYPDTSRSELLQRALHREPSAP